MRIYTNTTALNVQKDMRHSLATVANAITRLSSGLRINSARDDAAGQAIANRMSSEQRGNQTAQRNVQDAINLVNTALSGADEMNSNLQRMRELQVQYRNDTNTSQDKEAISKEINQLVYEIERISNSSNFNNLSLYSSDKTLNVQVGASANDTFDLHLDTINTQTLGLQDRRFGLGPVTTYSEGGVTASVVFKGVKNADGTFMSLEDSAAVFGVGVDEIYPTNIMFYEDSFGNVYDPPISQPVLRIGERYVSAQMDIDTDKMQIELYPMLLQKTFDYTNLAEGIDNERRTGEFWGYLGITDDPTSIYHNQINTYIEYNGDKFYNLSNLYADGPQKNSLTMKSPTENSLEKVDLALEKINEYRSKLGATSNRLDSMINTLQGESLSLVAAQSRILDADYAVETSNLTRGQILQQASQAVLAQANQIPQGVLQLLNLR